MGMSRLPGIVYGDVVHVGRCRARALHYRRGVVSDVDIAVGRLWAKIEEHKSRLVQCLFGVVT